MVAKNFGGCVTLGPQTNRILGRIVGAALAPLSGHLPPMRGSCPIGNAMFSPSLSTTFHRMFMPHFVSCKARLANCLAAVAG
jgi:hypothetical protein